MNRPLLMSIFFLVALGRVVRADPTQTTSAPATSAPATSTPATSTLASKWPYTFFNPVPADQLRDMDTDRPNVTNTPHTIDAGHLQIETGVIDYTYDHSRSIDSDVRSDQSGFGEANFRLGLFNNLEFNAAINSFDIIRAHDSRSGTTVRGSGFGDTSLGMKLNLWGDDGADGVWGTAMAIQPELKFPTARSSVGNGHFELAVLMPFQVNLPYDFHLGYQPGISHERSSDNTGYVTGLRNSISVDRVLIAKADIYLEYASDVTTERHVKAAQTIDIGGTYPLSENWIVDAGFNFGMNHATDNFEATAGVSVRF